MADARDHELNPQAGRTLAAALQSLPDAAPEPDLWPELARALAARGRRRDLGRRAAWSGALAAALLLALLLPRWVATPNPAAPDPLASAAPVAPARDASVAEIDDLRARSQTLERWIAAVAAHAPQDSRDLMAAVEVEDLIGLVDLQLGAARDGAEAAPLWRRRVALLEDLAAIRVGGFALAASATDALPDRALPVRHVN